MRRRIFNRLTLLVCVAHLVFLAGLSQMSEGGRTYWMKWRLDGLSTLNQVAWPGTDIALGPLVVLAPAVVPALWLVLFLATLTRRLLLIQRLRHGRCPVCGYDLRATSGRCPECGTPEVEGTEA
jgi:hypothetical protein